MYRFFVSPEDISDGQVRFSGETARHIARSLRMARGETVVACDGAGREYICRLDSFDEDREVLAEVLSSSRGESEPPIELRLYQAYPKGDKLDGIVMKATETGATSVTPFISHRCISRPEPARRAKIRERLARIALGAAEQSHRSLIPQIEDTRSFSEMLSEASGAELFLFCYEGGEGVETVELRELLSEYQDGRMPTSISIVIGSEGGFDREEAIAARDAGAKLCSLGRRILRCETASVFVLAGICCHFGI